MTDLTVREIRTTKLRMPYVEPPKFGLGSIPMREILLVEIETASGITGLGYIHFLRPGVATVEACVREMMAPDVIGRDATAVEAIWTDLFRGSFSEGRMGVTMLAQSAIDVALWDIVGKAAGMPLHRLWGHSRDKVPVYGSGCWRGLGGVGMVEKAERFVAQGFRAIKMQVGHLWGDAQDVVNVREMREALGPDIDIMVDVNQAWTADHAMQMAPRLQEHDIYWLEEPVVAHDFAGYLRLADTVTTRIVGGENHFGRADMRPFFGHNKIPILQPDVIRGGLTELRKIAVVADTWGIRIAPHLYPELMIQLVASIPNAEIIEDMGFLDDIWVEGPKPPEAGMIAVPERPGHGLEVKPEIIKDAKVP